MNDLTRCSAVHLFNLVSRTSGTDAKRAHEELQRRAAQSPSSPAHDLLHQIAEENLLQEAPGAGIDEAIEQAMDLRLLTDRRIDTARLRMISTAQREICVQTYVFSDDTAAQALISAKSRGCTVVVNVSKGPLRNASCTEVAEQLSMGGIRVDATQSIHTKLLLCDRRHILIGSANMRVTYRDAAIRLESPSLGARLFALYFARREVRSPHTKKRIMR